MNGLTKLLRSTAIVATLGVGGMLGGMGGQAHAATLAMPTNGTQACKATTAAGASSFYYNHTYLWNSGTTTQYLTCVLPEWNLSSSSTYTYLAFHFAAGATAGTVTCTAQVGSFYNGANQIESGRTRSLILSAGANGYMQFADYLNQLSIITYHNSINVICTVPPGFKFGLIEREKVAPTSW